jgi:hypothetical protein
MASYERQRQPASPELVRRLHAALAPIDQASERLDALVLGSAEPGSAAAADRLDPLTVRGYDLAVVFLRASLDHVWTWRTFLEAGAIPLYAHISLLRTAHESAYFALWLSASGLDAGVRRARAVAAQLDDYEERNKVEQAGGTFAPNPAGRGKTAQQRIDDLMAEADKAGLTRLNKNGVPILQTTMPSAVELFDLYEMLGLNTRGSFVYRLESGLVHAKQWAAMIGAKQAGKFDETGRAPALSMADDNLTLLLTLRVMNSIERALSSLEARFRSAGPST